MVMVWLGLFFLNGYSLYILAISVLLVGEGGPLIVTMEVAVVSVVGIGLSGAPLCWESHLQMM